MRHSGTVRWGPTGSPGRDVLTCAVRVRRRTLEERQGRTRMNCSHHMWDDPTGLRCTRGDAHDEEAAGGHIYESRDGSFTNSAEVAGSGA